MYTVTDFCLLCFQNNNNLEDILSKDCEDVLNEANLRCVLFEFIKIKPDLSQHTKICLACLENLKHLNKFKQRCVRNIIRLNDYLHLLKDTNEPCNNLNVTLIDLKTVEANQKGNDNEIKHEPIITDDLDESQKANDGEIINESIINNLDDQSQTNCEENNVITDQNKYEFLQNTEIEKWLPEVNVIEKVHEHTANEDNTVDKHKIIEGEATILRDDEVKFEFVDTLNEDNICDEIEIKSDTDNYQDNALQVDVPYIDTDSDCSMYEEFDNTSNGNITQVGTSTSKKTNVNLVPNINKAQVKARSNILAKRACCLYCKKLVVKLPRHLLSKHYNEEKVIQFESLPIKSAERQEIITELRKKGNFFYNQECIEKQTGDMIVKRIPNRKNVNGSKIFLPCNNCLGFYSQRTLYLHAKKCYKDHQNNSTVANLSKTLLPINPVGSNFVLEK